MTSITPGKAGALDRASDEHGVFTVFAVDHRDAMRAVLDPDDPDGVPSATLTGIKLHLTRAMSPHASAILLDPEYSAIEAVSSGAIGRDAGFLVALEAQGYLGHAGARTTALLDGWSVEQAKRLGASGVKLLLPYRPDTPASETQEHLVAEVVDACARWDLPLFLEPVGYPIPDAVGGPDRRWVVCESVRRLGVLGPDVLKVPFPADTSTVDLPAWRDACAELDEASPVPWALLSGGDPFESFVSQVDVACSAGASGFLVGRALWAPAVSGGGVDARALDEFVVPGFQQLAAIAANTGRNWRDRVGEGAFATPDWRDYR